MVTLVHKIYVQTKLPIEEYSASEHKDYITENVSIEEKYSLGEFIDSDKDDTIIENTISTMPASNNKRDQISTEIKKL